jgi:hypothetical protein
MQYRILLFSYNKNIIFFLQIFDFAITSRPTVGKPLAAE